MTVDGGGPLDLDRLLEEELRKTIGGLSGPTPSHSAAGYHLVAVGARSTSLLSSLTAAASTKAAAGLATAALVVGAGSVAATAATGSPNPSVWGKTVTAAVDTCKGDLKPGEHGIGPCVSAVAKQNGASQRSQHSASPAHQDHPTGPPSGAGRPSTVPVGPPSPLPVASGQRGHPTGAPVSPPSHR